MTRERLLKHIERLVDKIERAAGDDRDAARLMLSIAALTLNNYAREVYGKRLSQQREFLQ